MAGVQTLDLDKMFNLDSRTLGFGPAIHLPLFQRAQLHAAYGVRRRSCKRPPRSTTRPWSTPRAMSRRKR